MLRSAPPASLSPEQSALARTARWIAVLGSLLLYYWRFGYSFGLSDQDEVLPYLLHLLDPDLFRQDWFVFETQVQAFSVRRYFVYLLYLPSLVLPIGVVVALGYVLTWIALTWHLYSLGTDLTRQPLAAAAAVLATLCVFNPWTLGGNEFVYRMWVPEMLAWALVLPGLRLLLRQRWVFGATLLGVATWFQVLAALHVALVVGALLLLGALRGGTTWSAVVRFSAAFVGSSLPASIPLLLQQAATGGGPATEGLSIVYILGEFRAPHHYMPSLFGTAEYLRFGTLVLLGGIAWGVLQRYGPTSSLRVIAGFWAIAALLFGVGALGTEVGRIPFVMKLQVFKLAVPVKWLLVLTLCTALWHMLPDAARRLAERWAQFPTATATLLSLLLVGSAVAGWAGVGRAGQMMQPARHQASALGAVERWARTNTSTDAVFLVPPSVSSFRYGARRATVVNGLAIPFTDAGLRTWYERLQTVAPVGQVADGLGLSARLDAAYHQQPEAAWEAVANEYDARYLVRRRDDVAAALSWPVVFEAAPWVVYARPEPARP